MIKENKFVKMAEGQVAHAILDKLAPIVGRQQADLIEELKVIYRSGRLDATLIFAKLGELVALDNLEIALRQRVTQGARAQKEIDQ